MTKSKTEVVRDEIKTYLKTLNGAKVREADLTKYLMEHSHVATEPMARGIFNKIKGIGGIYKSIPNVSFVKEGNKVYYYYKKNSFPENSIMNKLSLKVQEFEDSLKKDHLWLSFLEMPAEERQPYQEFMEHFEKLKEMFEEQNER